jgi:hypothetical protein
VRRFARQRQADAHRQHGRRLQLGDECAERAAVRCGVPIPRASARGGARPPRARGCARCASRLDRQVADEGKALAVEAARRDRGG